MNSKPRTLIINTMTESKYIELSAAGRISDKQINIVDNDDAGRTVIASYDIVNEKVKNSQLSLSYDADRKRVQLVNAVGEEQSGFDASTFLKDGMLNGIAYDGSGLKFTVKTDESEYEKLSVAFVDSQILSASTNAVQGGAVYAGIKSLQAQILGFEEHLNVLDKNISAVINEPEDLEKEIAADSKNVNDTVKVVNSDGIVIYYKVTEENGVKKWEEYNRENAAFIPTENIDITANNATPEPRLFNAPLAKTSGGLSESNDRVPSSKLVGNLLSSKQAQIDAIDGRLGIVENDYVRYTAVPTQDLPERKAVILKNGDLITGKTRDGSTDRHLIGIAGSDRDIINVGANGIQLNLNTANYDCGALGTLNAINVNGGSDFVMTNGAMPMAVAGDGSTVNVQTREIAVLPGVNVKQLVISTDAESKANSHTDSEIQKLSAEVSTVYQTKIDSQMSAAGFDTRLSDIERDYLKNEDKTELADEISKKADLSALTRISVDGISVDSFGARHVSYEEYAGMLTAGTLLSNELYVVSSDNQNMYGQRVKNVASPADPSDAATKEYVDDLSTRVAAAANEYADGISGFIRTDLDNLSGTVMAILSDYALSSDASQEIASKTVSISTGAVTEGYLKSYAIYQGGSEIGVIDIPKDFLVKSGDVKTCEQRDTPVSGYVPGDKYLDFVVNAAISAISADDQHIYINVKDLTDIYKGADGEEISVGVDSGNNIGAVIKAGAVGREKIAYSVYGDISSIASSYAENRVRGLDAETVNGDASKTISKITETDGIVSAEFADISVRQDQVSGLAGRLSAIDEKFNSYYPSSQTSSSQELSDEFARYQLSGDYALSSDVSGKTELDTAFETLNAGISNFYACMWSAISAHTVRDGQLKSADQLLVDDIMYSFRDMAANLSAAWAQLNNA